MPTIIESGLTYYTRPEWGARTDIPRLGYLVNRLDRTEAIMHHTVIIDSDATPNRWETLAEVFTKMRQLQTIRPLLGLDVPYNFVAFHMADGSLVVCEGRGLDRTGAHTHGHNKDGIATAGEGNFQIGQTVVPYIGHWSRWWGWLKFDRGMDNLGNSHPPRGIAYGHKDLSQTACPGDKLYVIIPQLTFKEGDDMVLVKFSDQGGTVYFPLNGVLIRNALDAWPSMKALGYTVVDIKPNEPDVDLRSIRDWPRMKAEDLLPTSGGIDETQARAIAREEDDRLRVTK